MLANALSCHEPYDLDLEALHVPYAPSSACRACCSRSPAITSAAASCCSSPVTACSSSTRCRSCCLARSCNRHRACSQRQARTWTSAPHAGAVRAPRLWLRGLGARPVEPTRRRLRARLRLDHGRRRARERQPAVGNLHTQRRATANHVTWHARGRTPLRCNRSAELATHSGKHAVAAGSRPVDAEDLWQAAYSKPMCCHARARKRKTSHAPCGPRSAPGAAGCRGDRRGEQDHHHRGQPEPLRCDDVTNSKALARADCRERDEHCQDQSRDFKTTIPHRCMTLHDQAA